MFSSVRKCFSFFERPPTREVEDEPDPMTPVEIVNALLSGPLDIDNVRSLTTPDVNYVSLNKDHADLTRVLPWAGSHYGPEEIVKAFRGIYAMWEPVSF